MAIKAGNKENVELRKIVLCISSARFSIFDFHEKICNEPRFAGPALIGTLLLKVTSLF